MQFEETYYVSASKTNQLMLFKENIVVYIQNHTKHRNALFAQNTVVLC
jgi:hypothetical protein